MSSGCSTPTASQASPRPGIDLEPIDPGAIREILSQLSDSDQSSLTPLSDTLLSSSEDNSPSDTRSPRRGHLSKQAARLQQRRKQGRAQPAARPRRVPTSNTLLHSTSYGLVNPFRAVLPNGQTVRTVSEEQELASDMEGIRAATHRR